MSINDLKLYPKSEVRVKNVEEYEQNGCRCGTWLDHWKKFSYVKIQKCVVVGCSNIDLAGCPVIRSNPEDNNIYIIPLCKEHSQSKEELKILPSCPFVSANLKITCGDAGTVVTKYVEI
jgi:hypothetical protein